MKTVTIAALSATFALLAGTAAAQTSSDEARALAAQATAAHEREALTRLPLAEPAALGDYRAEAHELSRRAQWQARQEAIRAYAAGQRTPPIAVHSEDSARAEAQRVHAEQVLAGQAAGLKETLAAQ